jgi:hypothetical protein
VAIIPLKYSGLQLRTESCPIGLEDMVLFKGKAQISLARCAASLAQLFYCSRFKERRVKIQTKTSRLQPTAIALVLIVCVEKMTLSAADSITPVGGAESNEVIRTDSVSIPVSDATRPRTLAEVHERQKMRADQRTPQKTSARHEFVAKDGRARGREDYDAAFIVAVQRRWGQLLNSHAFVPHPGKVVLNFRLSQDGQITQMQETLYDVGPFVGLLCQAAVLDQAPYPAWPPEMRQVMGEDYHYVTFTFCHFNDGSEWIRSHARQQDGHLTCNLQFGPNNCVCDEDREESPSPNAGWQQPWPLYDLQSLSAPSRKDMEKDLEKELRKNWQQSYPSPLKPRL